MKKANKLLSLILGVAGVFALCSCSGAGFTDVSVDMSVDLNNKIPLKGLYPNSGSSNSGFANSYTTSLLKEITGYDVEYVQVLDSDMKSSVQNYILKEEPFNFIKMDEGTYEGLVTQNSFLDLKPLLEKYGQNLLANIPQEAWDAVTYEGKIYAIPEIAFSPMQDCALVWNLEHLNEVGITKIPSTVAEVTEAFEKLHAAKSSSSTYRVFGLAGSQSDCEVLSSAWETPNKFFVNDEGKIQQAIYHENYISYMSYMNQMVVKGWLPREWQSTVSTGILTNLANGNISCGYLNYWSMNTLYSLVASSKNISIEQAKQTIGFSTRIKGDGTSGSVVQEEAKFKSGIGLAYYISIPSYMGNGAAYAIDWMNSKITDEAVQRINGGDEGVHYTLGTASDENAIEITINQKKEYRILTDRFEEDLQSNSMYSTGSNQKIAAALWPLREASYQSWPIQLEIDDKLIQNPMDLRPLLVNWAPISIAARSWILTLEQQIINTSKDAGDVAKRVESLRSMFVTRYWNETVDTEVQAWYSSKKD